MDASERLVVALDVETEKEAMLLFHQLFPRVKRFKLEIGAMTLGWARKLARDIFQMGGKVLWDPKFHEIPSRIAVAARAVAALNVEFFTVHALAGNDSLRAACAHAGNSRVLAATVLSSVGPAETQRLYRRSQPQWAVCDLTDIAIEDGLHGILCSGQDLDALSSEFRLRWKGKRTTVFAMGIRPAWASPNDHQRPTTPAEAISHGADYLIIGRPIIRPPEDIGTPVDAAKLIIEEMETALEQRNANAAVAQQLS